MISGSGAVALAHLDGSGTDEAVCNMIQRVQELAMGYPEGRIELQLVGGFSDAHHYSEELFYNIMGKFLSSPSFSSIKLQNIINFTSEH